MPTPIEMASNLIFESSRIVVFTGAGISTESGIPDFRSPGGIWSKYDPSDFTFQRFLSSETAREKYWQMSTEFYNTVKSVKPNAAHLAVAELEKMGKLDCVITQNIDGLHQMAGCSAKRVIELHGTALAVSCLDCHKRYDRDLIQKRISDGDRVPRCDVCNGLLKPATISFGQTMPEKETAEAMHRSAQCDLFIVIGSSLVVQPAASMPLIAKEKGAKLVIINRDDTPYDHLADVRIHDSAGAVLPEILQRVRALS
ncbi:MAG: NAD-dependent deacylase [Deltaproteobacteria bacterium]|nr:NAD-dependent deacylase [Deltaproteobacteria bacterium]MBW1961631.1 NAD-dependent deacylase [Deltaproteobacteria bacterium]MBW2151324.1 NAD-dependent deacylase [Deltaproteobacteria bacterium]